MGAEGALKVAPKAPLPRRVREIPPKAGISRVFIKTYNYDEQVQPPKTAPYCTLSQPID